MRRHDERDRNPRPFCSPDHDVADDSGHYRSVPSQLSPPPVPLDAQPFSYSQRPVPAPIPSKQRPHRLNPSSGSIPHEYEVEPFYRDGPPRPPTHPSTSGRSDDTSTQGPRRSLHEPGDVHSPTATRPEQQENNSQVYVIHHDSGRAPVSVITSRGTEVVELPPGYSPDYLPAGGSNSQATATGSVQRRQTKSPAGSGADRGRTP